MTTTAKGGRRPSATSLFKTHDRKGYPPFKRPVAVERGETTAISYTIPLKPLTNPIVCTYLTCDNDHSAGSPMEIMVHLWVYRFTKKIMETRMLKKIMHRYHHNKLPKN